MGTMILIPDLVLSVLVRFGMIIILLTLFVVTKAVFLILEILIGTIVNGWTASRNLLTDKLWVLRNVPNDRTGGILLGNRLGSL